MKETLLFTGSKNKHTNKHFVYMTERACFKAQEQGKEFSQAFVFISILKSLTEHPILFNFKANMVAYRIQTQYTDRKFRILLNLAIKHGLVYLEGDHLRVFSRSQERRMFKIRSGHKYTKVSIQNVERFYQMAVLKNNTNSQEGAIKYKEQPRTKGHGTGVPNYDITLSYRKIANLLYISQPYAIKLSKKLKDFGLCLTPNRRIVTREEFYKHRYFPSTLAHLYRYDQESSQFFFLLANKVSYLSYNYYPI